MAGLVSVIEKGDAVALARSLRESRYPLVNAGIQPLLHVAVNAPTNCWVIVRMLLEAGVPINATDLAGATALHVAADKGHVKCVQELLRLGAKVNQGDKDGRIPLHYAARNRSKKGVKCLQFLIESGSSIDTPARQQYTALHVASEIGNVSAVKMLLKAGADHAITDNRGCTPLHMATTPGVAEVLLNSGANGRTCDSNQQCVLTKAIKHSPAIVQKLLNAGITIQGDNQDCSMRVYFHLNQISGDLNETSSLKEMIRCDRYDFLKHPLCETFLHLKWIQVCLLFYMKLVLFLCIIVTLTVSSSIRESFSEHGKSILPNEQSDTNSNVLIYMNAFAKLMLAILLVVSLLQMITLKAYFFRQLKKLWELLFMASSLILLIIYNENMMNTWENHIWVGILMGGWCHVIVLLGHIPNIGIYVHMFKRVSIRMLTFAGVYSSLFIGFTVSFHLVFKGDVFSDIWISGLKTLAMMVGELDFASILGGDTKPALQGTAQVIFVLFVLLMTVVITNLLVGLAVQDIQMLQKEAGVSRLALTVEQETSVDKMLSSPLIRTIMPPQLHQWLENKCSLLYHLPERSLHDANTGNQAPESDTSVDWWIRRGTRSQRRGPMEHYNIFIRPYNPKSPGKVYFSDATKLIPTSYTLPGWIVNNTKLLIENGLHTKECDIDLIPDDGEEEVQENDTNDEQHGLTLENLQEQLNELQKSVTVMSQMLKKSLSTK